MSQGPAALVRLWYHAEMQGPTSTLVSIGLHDTTKDVISKLQAILERRMMPRPETKMKDLRVLILHEEEDKFYPIPVANTIYSGARNSGSKPVSTNGPILVTAALCDLNALKTDNPNWVENVEVPLQIPNIMMKTIIGSVATLNNPMVNIIKVNGSKSRSPNRLSSSEPIQSPRETSVKSPEIKTDNYTMSPSVGALVANSIPALHYGAIEGICEVTYRLPQDIVVNDSGSRITSPMGSALSPIRTTVSASLHSPIRRIGNRGGSPIRSSITLSPDRANNCPVVMSTVTAAVKYLRGDTAEEVIRNVLLRMRIEHKSIPASYFPTSVSCLMLCTAEDDNSNINDTKHVVIGFETFSQKDCMPIYTSGKGSTDGDVPWNTIKMHMIDIGDRYLPRNSTMERYDSLDLLTSPNTRYTSGKEGIANVQSIDYISRSARLKKLTAQITTETDNTTELENEYKRLSMIAVEEQEKKEACEAERLEVLAAKRDIDRLSGLKQWFTKELEDRQEIEKEYLRIRVLGGESDWETSHHSYPHYPQHSLHDGQDTSVTA
eukprot:Tbor_TRINITY_DN934_c0_g1::TRINITY_DN934_c0_g1_i1::g.21118::m.21118